MQPFEEFEQEYAKHLGINDTVSVNTGTAALHVALEALRLPPGSKVIVPEFTMYASALAVYYARLIPVFVDCQDDLLMDLNKLEEAIDKDTRVIMVTHIYGRLVDMTAIMSLAKKYNLRVIEDACEAQGAHWEGKPIGTFDIGCFSLYRNKIIHAEEGGVVASKDQDLLKIVRDMKSMSFGEHHNYYHERIGFNYRMTNSQSLMGIESLRKYKENAENRRRVESVYASLLPSTIKMPYRSAVWVYDFISPKKDEIVKTLNDVGVPARHSFKPMSMMPLFREWASDYRKLNAYKQSKQVGYLPVYPDMTSNSIEKICYTVNTILEK